MAVITISREYGSNGDLIAAKTAQVLGYHLVGKELIGALLSEYGLVEFDKEYERLPGFWERFNAQREQRRQQIVQMLNQIVPALAQHGNVVIVGRSGFAMLQGYGDVLNVRVQAPLAIRVASVMAEQGIEAEQAEASIVDADKGRAAFIESFYGVRWNDATAFDLVINANRIAPELAAHWIAQAVQALTERGAGHGLTCASIEVDPILAKAVRAALDCQDTHS
ncbi:MAG TPA: cytidylate kinase-like family protein [Anaerolineae bacterium]|nr:cytidylate kinase-like family protein [Anaerolineae bacterium]